LPKILTDSREFKENLRFHLLVRADDPNEPVAVLGKMFNGLYGLYMHAEVNPVIVLAFGIGAWLSPRKPK
jgi:hypothetical protein